MRFPTLFVNHGGGPMPLMGRQPALTKHMKDIVVALPGKPSSIVVVSAHWEGDPIRITSSEKPDMLFDYYGFPPETYEYSYPAPGDPTLAHRIQSLVDGSVLETERGFDHGVFVPLMLMYPDADIPVVAVSLNASLSAKDHLALGRALEPLRDDGVLILGSGYTFHNMDAFFNPSEKSYRASEEFNDWLKATMLHPDSEERQRRLEHWERAPGARLVHPREEHLLPLFVVAAAAGVDTKASLVYEETTSGGNHAVSGYIFD